MTIDATEWTDVSPGTTGYKGIIKGAFYAGNREIYAGQFGIYAGYMSLTTWTDVSATTTTWSDV